MKRPHGRAGPILVLLVILSLASARAEDAVSVRVSPQFCVEGSNVRVTVRVEPRDENRTLTIEADSDNFFRSSTIQLSGARAPVVHYLRLNALPSGTYEVRATVMRVDDVTSTALKVLRVVGSSREPAPGLGENASGPEQ